MLYSIQSEAQLLNWSPVFHVVYLVFNSSASNRIISAKDHASIQINVAAVSATYLFDRLIYKREFVYYK